MTSPNYGNPGTPGYTGTPGTTDSGSSAGTAGTAGATGMPGLSGTGQTDDVSFNRTNQTSTTAGSWGNQAGQQGDQGTMNTVKDTVNRGMDNAQDAIGQLQAKASELTSRLINNVDVDDLTQKLEMQVREHPTRTLLMAAGAGFLLGRAAKR